VDKMTNFSDNTENHSSPRIVNNPSKSQDDSSISGYNIGVGPRNSSGGYSRGVGQRTSSNTPKFNDEYPKDGPQSSKVDKVVYGINSVTRIGQAISSLIPVIIVVLILVWMLKGCAGFLY